MKISKRDKIFLLAGGVFLLLAAFYQFVIVPIYNGYLDTESEIAAKSKLLARYQGLWERKTEVEKKLKAIQGKYENLEAMFLKENNQSLAAAELQKILEGLSAKSNATISSSKVMGSKKEGKFEEITIQLGIKSSLKNLLEFLYLVENAKEYISIGELHLRVLSFQDLEKLDTKMEVSGFIKSSGP